MPTVINGLPAHVLLIHVIIILIPLGALFTVLSAVWPAARHKLGFISPLTCLIAFVFVPITIHAGRWLQLHLAAGPAVEARIQKHANLGSSFWIYSLLLLLVSAAVWFIGRRYEITLRPNAAQSQSTSEGTEVGGGGTATATQTRTRSQTALQALPVWASALIAVVSVAVAIVVTWQLYRVGDAGAKAVWTGVAR